MTPGLALLLFALCFFGCATAYGQDRVAASCSGAGQTVVLPVEGPLRIIAPGATEAWIEIRESGQQIKVSGDPSSEILRIAVPLRFGQYWVFARPGRQIDIERFQANSAAGAVVVSTHCEPSSPGAQRLAWIRTAAELADSLSAPLAKGKLDSYLESLRALARSAPDDKDSALALHMVAQAYLVNDRNADAAPAFETAEKSWMAGGAPEHALVARVARAEELRRTGQYSAALALTSGFSDRWESYFRVRLENTRCLALNNLGQYPASESCYEANLRRLKNLGERGELVDTLYDFALLLENRGQGQKAQMVANQALAEVSTVNVPYIQGHVRYLLGWLAFRRGELARALLFADQALAYFEAAHMPRWEANALFDVATVYRSVDALDEAYSALSDAVSRLSMRDAPARMASAMIMFASLEQRSGNIQSAQLWSAAASAVYANLKMPLESDGALRLQLELRLQSGHPDGLLEEVSAHLQTESLNVADWLILAVRVSLNLGELRRAGEYLDRVSAYPLQLSQQVHVALLKARVFEGYGDSLAAQQAIATATDSLRLIADHAGNPVLRYAIENQTLVLRRAGMSSLLSRSSNQPQKIVEITRWLARSAEEEQVWRPVNQDDAFSSAVAAELLSTTPSARRGADSAAQRQLLSILAQSGHDRERQESTTTPALTVASIQQSLDADSVFAAYLDGNTRGALLWITHDTATVLDAAAPEDVRTASLALRFKLRSAGASIAEIDSAQRSLSDALLSNLRGSPPKRLYVLSDESTDGVAWSVLRWPGRSDSLIDTTAVSVVQLEDGKSATSMQPPASVRVIVAAQKAEREPSLPRLAGADSEARQIEAALAQNGIGIDGSAAATRASVLSTLGEAGAWVHIAAHGMAQPQRIGYAGIWLEPTEQDTTPPFLSWLDVLDSGARADLVLLDACRLGDSGNVIGANLSFAAAVVRAGARHVVAAAWPVSDSASAMWVPAFYEALTGDPRHDPAQALRAAQLRLRQSRAFTHPFFWASLQTLERLPVDVSREPAPKIARTY